MKALQDHTVAELMQRGVQTVKETASLAEAIRLMGEKKLSSLIVEKEHEHDAYGILTRKDIITELSENWDGMASLNVADLATKPVITIQANTGVKHAVRLMRVAGVRRLAVLEGNELAGIISNSDVFRFIIEWESVKK